MQEQIFFDPDPSLKKFIRYFWIYKHDISRVSEIPVRIMADRFPKLILQDPGLCGRIKTTESCNLPESFVSGIITKPKLFRISHRYSHVGVSFMPHALKYIFDVKSEDLIDCFFNMSELVPEDLHRSLNDAVTGQAKIQILSQFFRERIASSEWKVCGAVEDIISNTHKYRNLNVKLIAEKNGLATRSIQRHFMDQIGITPKKYLQLYKFELSYKRLKIKTCEALSDIGYDLCYSDQSHFIRNFKEYSGILPTNFVKELKMEREGKILIWNYTKSDLETTKQIIHFQHARLGTDCMI